MRWVKAVTAGLAMLLVIAGAPVLLIGWGSLGSGWWRADDGSLLFALLTVAGWLAWAAFTLATVLEIIRQTSGRRFVPDMPLLGGLQALCAGLVFAVVSVAASSGAGSAPPAANPSLSHPSLDAASVLAERSAEPVDEASGSGADGEPMAVSVGEASTVAERSDSESYLVATGDDLWSIAERLLGEGRRWRELVRANHELLSDPTAPLVVGTRLSLPAASDRVVTPGLPPSAVTKPDASSPSASPKTIVVERGDTLSGLAKEHLGSTGRWPRIAAANSELISNPDHIEIGWELVIPERRSKDSRPAPEADQTAAPTQPDTEGQDLAAEAGTEPGRPDLPPDHDPQPAPLDVSAGPSGEPGRPKLPAEPDVEHGGPDLPMEPGAEAEQTPQPGQPDLSTDPEASPGEQTEPREQADPANVESANPGSSSQDSEAADAPADYALIGSLGALAAAGLMGGWQARRLLQGRVREPGRRVLQPDDNLTRLHAAVGRRQLPDHGAVLDTALRAIGRHFHRLDQPLPDLVQVTLTAERIRFHWASSPGSPPTGLDGDHTSWWVQLPSDGSNPLLPVEHPCPYPALVSLGTSADGETVLIDLEHSGLVGVAAEHPELQLASLASIAVELACAPWACELTLISVGTDGDLAQAAGGDAVLWLDDADAALVRLRQHHAERRRELTGLDLARLRADPERADAVTPQVYVFHDPLTADQQDQLDGLLTGSRLGIAALVIAEAATDARWELFGDPLHPRGRFAGGGLNTEQLDAHAIPAGTREAVTSWYQLTESTRTEPAPWWSHEEASNLRLLPSRHTPSEDSVDIVSLRRLVRAHPTLLLIGPIDLISAAGPEPSRARYQLMEACSWLLEHPGRTATEMAIGLGIAETTRRSNLSRLRTWLGDDPSGDPYLPEAYTGRIRLHPDVTSDVQQLRLLTGPGVNRIGEDGLVAALDLVRGGMLADAAPGQWYWAEQLRSDVAATLRDAGLVLTDRAVQRGDLDLARWATERALMVAPEDELLMCARIRTEHAAGNRPGVERHVLRLTQQARALGVDLMPATVMLCQQVMEGRTRARRA